MSAEDAMNILSVSQIIEATFPDETTKCKINFRLLKMLVVIIANQLRVLNRHVLVNVESDLQTSSRPSLVVSEVKLQIKDEVKDSNKKNKKDDQKRKETKKKRYVRKKQEYQNQDDNVQSVNDSINSGGVKGVRSTEEAANLHQAIVDDLEEQRERELRIISQRADSHEEPLLSPSPMASVHSLSELHITKENVLVVTPQGRPPKINVVTKEQFDALENDVRELQGRTEPIGIPGFPENTEFMKALRRGASLTDAMAALQMSARLQAFEKAFVIMMSLLTELAKKTPGVDVTQFSNLETNFAQGLPLEVVTARKQNPAREGESKEINDGVSRAEFNNAMHELYEEVVTMVKKSQPKTHDSTTMKGVEALISALERKFEAHNYEQRIKTLETEIAECSDELDHLDTNLSAQIGGYQEELNQMQYQLDTAIGNLTDKLTVIRSDPEALAQLNERCDSLQHDADNAAHEQNNIKVFQENMALDLARLWKEIELIRDAKADREEVQDALRDKAGIENLNGMVRRDHFEAIHGELEAKILASYHKFNHQELVWQNALDDLAKVLNEKSDWVHVCALREDINKHLNKLKDKIDGLVDVVGEPRAAAVRKELFRNADCVCCGTPALMNMEEPVPKLPSFKRASADGAESTPNEGGDHRVCIPDRPIPKTSKNHICHRFCGGSHTLMPHMAPAPPGVTITRLSRTATTTVGSDGKAYLTDEHIEIKPCGRCNVPETDPEPSTKDIVSEFADEKRNTFDTDITWLPKYNSGPDYPDLPSYDF